MAPYRRRMVNAARARDDIGRLVRRGLPVPEFAQAVGAVIRRAVPAEGTCLMTLDPATLGNSAPTIPPPGETSND